MNWIAMALGVIGAILNARLNIFGFIVWIIANGMWIYIYWGVDWAVVILFGVYTAICVMGIHKWAKAIRVLNNARKTLEEAKS